MIESVDFEQSKIAGNFTLTWECHTVHQPPLLYRVGYFQQGRIKIIIAHPIFFCTSPRFASISCSSTSFLSYIYIDILSLATIPWRKLSFILTMSWCCESKLLRFHSTKTKRQRKYIVKGERKIELP